MLYQVGFQTIVNYEVGSLNANDTTTPDIMSFVNNILPVFPDIIMNIRLNATTRWRKHETIRSWFVMPYLVDLQIKYLSNTLEKSL